MEIFLIIATILLTISAILNYVLWKKFNKYKQDLFKHKAQSKSDELKRKAEKQESDRKYFFTPDYWKTATIGKVEIADDNGIDIFQESLKGENILMLAAENNDNENLIKWLIKRGFPVNTKTDYTPLMYAARKNKNVLIVNQLIKAGADINATCKQGMTALSFACAYNNNPQIIKALLDAGADANIMDVKGRTAKEFLNLNKDLNNNLLN